MAAATVSTASVPITTVEHPLRNPNYRLWLIGGTISLRAESFNTKLRGSASAAGPASKPARGTRW